LLFPFNAVVEESSQRHAHKGVCTVGTVVDVLFELPSLSGRAATASHQRDRINFQQDGSCAARFAGLRIKDVSFAERKLFRLNPRGVLVQQVAEVRRRTVRCSNREKHCLPV
jgi:hypothetical protein